MSGLHSPRLSYSLYSTPFSRNDSTQSYVGWISLPPKTAETPTGGSGLASGEGQCQDFHNHFQTPAVQRDDASAPSCSDTSIEENDEWTHPSPYASPFIVRPTPTENQIAENSQQQGHETNATFDFGRACPVFSAHANAGVSQGMASVIGITPSSPVMPTTNGWFRTERQQQPYPEQMTVPMTTTTGFDLRHLYPNFSFWATPPQYAEMWKRFNDLRFFTSDFDSPYVSSVGDNGLGDHQNFQHKTVPLSPLDCTSTSIASYLTNYSVPLEMSIRQNFTTRYHVLRACNQIAPIPIDLIFNRLQSVYKVNEGVFGEVYSGTYNGIPSKSVYKVVPIEGSNRVNGEIQKRFDQIETEIRVSQRLNTLLSKRNRNQCPGFCELHRARVLTGHYPQVLVRAWNKWHHEHQSDNDVPNFGDDQLYVVFEYEHCGADVESFRFQNAEQAFSVLMQVAFSLAAAELELEFEHRDLHWGNILVKETNKATIAFNIDGIQYEVPSSGLKTSIIDFTMARCRDELGNPIFDDLQNDEVQFQGTTDYQFEIYRKMREINQNNWSPFYPRTNTFWLHYFSEKLLNSAYYADTTSRQHKSYHTILKTFMDSILSYGSCADYVKTLSVFLAKPGSARHG